MCAIAGVAGNGPANKKLIVANMLATMKHRGPDYTGVVDSTDLVSFGHNRLSIIDHQSSANQPFTSTDGRYILVFNGEIYNYLELRAVLATEFQFKTNSDTEVLLMAFRKWGVACLEKFIGMFAFAIWDNQEKILVAARDRFGVKPFYYGRADGMFLFASEIKALWAAGLSRVQNKSVWASYFVYGSYGLPNETFWSGVHQLPAGHYLVWTAQEVVVRRWYNFEDSIEKWRVELSGKEEKEITRQYFDLLQESIRLRFRADVPVGFNVSGGLDSSLLLSLINKYTPDNETVRAYTFFTGNPEYDELPWVNALMRTTSYSLHAVKFEATHVPAHAAEMSWVQDEPFGGIPTLAYGNLFKEARRCDTVVLLDGQGMDEAWAGYDYFQTENSSVVQGVSGSPLRPEALDLEFQRMAVKPNFPEPFADRLLDLQYRDLFFTKLPRALRFNDRASMQHATELREPFLDHRLVEMAFALPRSFKIQNGSGKYLLRKVTSTLLPDSIRYAPKRALQTPQREWFAKELRDWVDAQLMRFVALPGIDKGAVMKEWKNYLEQRSDNSFYLWQWINTTLLV